MKSYKFDYSEEELLNIEKIIEKFGDDYIVNSKGNLSYNCPFCEEVRGKPDNERKFNVQVKNTVYHCFKCHTSGIVIKSKLSNAEIVIPVIKEYFKDEKENKNIIKNVGLLEFNNVEPIKRNSVAYDYLVSRKITDDQILYYNIMNGINDNFGRIMIPNELIIKWTDFYQGRSYLNLVPKYLNPEEVDKSNIVFNLHNQKQNQKRVYIVEGVFSAIRSGKDVICIYGSSISDVQVELIKKYNFEEIYCCLDGDEAGTLGNKKMSRLLFERTNSIIYTVKLPENVDPADLGEYKFKEYCEKYKRLYINKTINNIMTYFDY